MLEEKWITPLVLEINKLPENIINNLCSKLKNLKEKYNTTFSEMEKQITDTETSLSYMIDELTGDEYDIKGLGKLKSLLKGK